MSPKMIIRVGTTTRGRYTAEPLPSERRPWAGASRSCRMAQRPGAVVNYFSSRYVSLLRCQPIPPRLPVISRQGKYDEADPLHQRVLAINEKVYGPDDGVVIAHLIDWGESLKKRVRTEFFGEIFILVGRILPNPVCC